jgi:hypothetical protein
MTGVASRSAERGHKRSTRMVAEPIARIAKVNLDCRVILSCVASSNNRANACRCSRKHDRIWSCPIGPCREVPLTRGRVGPARGARTPPGASEIHPLPGAGLLEPIMEDLSLPGDSIRSIAILAARLASALAGTKSIQAIDQGSQSGQGSFDPLRPRIGAVQSHAIAILLTR